MNPPEARQLLQEKINPKPLDDLTTKDAEQGAIYLCMVCGEEFEEGKNARGHAGCENHRKWVRHPKLPKGWTNPYKLVADNELGGANAY